MSLLATSASVYDDDQCSKEANVRSSLPDRVPIRKHQYTHIKALQLLEKPRTKGIPSCSGGQDEQNLCVTKSRSATLGPIHCWRLQVISSSRASKKPSLPDGWHEACHSETSVEDRSERPCSANAAGSTLEKLGLSSAATARLPVGEACCWVRTELAARWLFLWDKKMPLRETPSHYFVPCLIMIMASEHWHVIGDRWSIVDFRSGAHRGVPSR